MALKAPQSKIGMAFGQSGMALNGENGFVGSRHTVDNMVGPSTDSGQSMLMSQPALASGISSLPGGNQMATTFAPPTKNLGSSNLGLFGSGNEQVAPSYEWEKYMQAEQTGSQFVSPQDRQASGSVKMRF